MFCPSCGNKETTVLETINQPKATIRRKKCAECGTKFFTREEPVSAELVKPVFDEWVRERQKKLRLKKKGEAYDVRFADGREKPVTPKKPTSPLF